MTTKLYPFSAKKHAHDIEYRYNRAKNELYDYESGEVEMTAETANRIEALKQELADLICAIQWNRDNRGVAWLTGEQYSLAMQSVQWAEAMRAEANR